MAKLAKSFTAEERLGNTSHLSVGRSDGWEGKRRSDTAVERFLALCESAGFQVEDQDGLALGFAIAVDAGFLRWVATIQPDGKLAVGKAPLLTEPAEGSVAIQIPAYGAFKGGYECVKDGHVIRSVNGKPAKVAKVREFTPAELTALKEKGINQDEAYLVKHLRSLNICGPLISGAKKILAEREKAAKKEAKTEAKEAKATPAKAEKKAAPKAEKKAPRVPKKKAEAAAT